MTNEQTKERVLKQALWKRGKILDFLLDETQKDMVKQWEESVTKNKGRKFIFLCSRRLGKTYTLCAIAVQQAIQSKRKIVYITATFKDAREIVQPLIAKITEDCPPECKPTYKTQNGKYVFPNGSEMLLFGADRNPDGPRGQESDFIIIDEAGFIGNLDYLMSSVLMPMIMTTDGRIVMATTPPRSMDHPFMKLWGECLGNGNLVKKTIYDCPRISPKTRDEYMQECGGEKSPSWRREYLLEAIADEQDLVIPEFNDVTEKELVCELPEPPWCDRYVGMDLGFTDNTAACFGFWDFQKAHLYIQDEIVLKKQNYRGVAEGIKGKETALWGSKEVYKRISDHNEPRLISELNATYGLQFSPATKSFSKEVMINQVRLAIEQGKIKIHPRCTNLRMQLKFCRWKGTNKLTFDRSEQFGHFDLVDALILLWHSLNRGRKQDAPIPDVYTQHVTAQHKQENDSAKQLLALISARKPFAKINRKWK